MTTTVCLTVLGIVGTFCVEGAQPIGDCEQRLAEVMDCVVQESELPLWTSYYMPPLGGINCDSDCSVVADGTAVTDCYDWCVACPIGWYGRWLDLGDIGQWQCRDHGGAIHPVYGERYTPEGFVTGWSIPIDLLVREEPPFAYRLLWEWGEA